MRTTNVYSLPTSFLLVHSLQLNKHTQLLINHSNQPQVSNKPPSPPIHDTRHPTALAAGFRPWPWESPTWKPPCADDSTLDPCAVGIRSDRSWAVSPAPCGAPKPWSSPKHQRNVDLLCFLSVVSVSCSRHECIHKPPGMPYHASYNLVNFDYWVGWNRHVHQPINVFEHQSCRPNQTQVVYIISGYAVGTNH